MFGLGLGLNIGRPALSGGSLTAQVQALFAGGKVGGMWDFGDTATLFQDTAGATPVTAVTQPIGMVLDKSQGLALGAEAVPSTNWNGGYTTNGAKQIPTGWVEYNSANVASSTVSPNSYQFTATAHIAGIQLAIPAATVIGRFNKYTIRARKTAFVSGTSSLQLYTGEWQEIVPSGAAIGDWYTKTIYALATNHLIISSFTDAGSWEVEYLTVKEQFGNHATQPTAGSRPLYQVVSSYGCAQFDGANDFLQVGTTGINLASADKLLIGLAFKPNTTSLAIAMEYSNSAPGNAGAFYVALNEGGAGNHYLQANRGGLVDMAVTPTQAASAVTTLVEYIDLAQAGTLAKITARINGAIAALSSVTDSADSSGAFGNYNLHIGARSGGSVASNMNVYRAFVRAGSSTAGEQLILENWLRESCGV